MLALLGDIGYINDMDAFVSKWADHWWARLVRLYPTVGTKPIVKINKRLKTTAGRMAIRERVMDLSADLLELYPDQFSGDIIPHELSHQVAFDVYRIGDGVRNNWHGKEWCAIMGSIGCKPETYHSMVNTKWKRR